MVFITHDDCLKHKTGFRHPESAARLKKLLELGGRLEREGVVSLVEAPLADRGFIEELHDPGYVSEVLDFHGPGLKRLDSDTALSAGTPAAALRAVGAVVLGVDMVLDGDTDSAFCAVRPPGHHASRSKAKGFCFFNNVVLAAKHAAREYGVERIAILDFDAHHANGTEALLDGDASTLLCQTFQHPFYPFTGEASSKPTLVNVPLDAGAGSREFREAVEGRWLPALRSFKPEFILVSAGFDAHRDDPLSGLTFEDADYAWIGETIAAAAAELDVKTVSILEGGYNLDALARSAELYLRGF